MIFKVSPIRVQNKLFSTQVAEKTFKIDLFMLVEDKFLLSEKQIKERNVERFSQQGSK